MHDDASGTFGGMLDRVTIGDVAERAGVSIATVSRVVNGRYGVAQATLDRVKVVIADLGYESSLIARSLRSQRTNVIGILVTDIEPFSAEVLKGAANALRGGEYELVVYSGGHGGDNVGWERRYISRLGGTLTDGTILVTPTVTEVLTNQPVVAVDPHSGASAFPTVRIAELRRRALRHSSSDRARASTYRLPRRSQRPRIGAIARRGLSGRAGRGRNPFRFRVGARRRLQGIHCRGAGTLLAVARTSADGDLRSQRLVGDPDHAHGRATRYRGLPRTVRDRIRQRPRVGAHGATTHAPSSNRSRLSGSKRCVC